MLVAMVSHAVIFVTYYLAKPERLWRQKVYKRSEREGFQKKVWSCEYILKGTEEYCDCSDSERVKCGVLPWMNLDEADVRWFDFVIFVSVEWRRCLGSVLIQITSWIKYLLISSVSVLLVPHRNLGTNTNGITVWIDIIGKVLLSSISDFQKWSQMLVILKYSI